MSILKEICSEKLLEVNKLKSTITESKLLDLIKLQEKMGTEHLFSMCGLGLFWES